MLVNDAARVHFTYRRYLENRMREQFDFGGTSIVLRFRTKERIGANGRAVKRDVAKPDTRKTLDKKFSGTKPPVRRARPKKAAEVKSDPEDVRREDRRGPEDRGAKAWRTRSPTRGRRARRSRDRARAGHGKPARVEPGRDGRESPADLRHPIP